MDRFLNNIFMQLSGLADTDWILMLHRQWSGEQVTEYLLTVRLCINSISIQ